MLRRFITGRADARKMLRLTIAWWAGYFALTPPNRTVPSPFHFDYAAYWVTFSMRGYKDFWRGTRRLIPIPHEKSRCGILRGPWRCRRPLKPTTSCRALEYKREI